jgi:hypothetical protein
MELVLSAIAAGGLVGASDQYMCLLIVALAAKLNWITLASSVDFMSSWWFIVIVFVFWLLTVAPAYASLLSPGLLHAVNTVVNFLSGFVVPASSALIGLASVGVIASLNPDLRHALETMRIFDPQGHLGAAGAVIAGGSAVTALVLTGSKGLAKPALSVSTGTAGTASAPIFATIENVASVVLMALAYELCRVNPWLIVALLAVVIVAVAALVVFALYQLRRLKKGLGRWLAGVAGLGAGRRHAGGLGGLGGPFHHCSPGRRGTSCGFPAPQPSGSSILRLGAAGGISECGCELGQCLAQGVGERTLARQAPVRRVGALVGARRDAPGPIVIVSLLPMVKFYGRLAQKFWRF